MFLSLMIPEIIMSYKSTTLLAIGLGVLLLGGILLFQNSQTEATGGNVSRTPVRGTVTSRDTKATTKARSRDDQNSSIRVNQIAGQGTLERLRKARQSALRTKFDLFGGDGILTSPAIANLKLTEDEVKFVQDSTAEIMASCRRAVVDNLVVDTLRSDEINGIRAFTIKSFDLNVDFDRYAAKLVSSLGRERAGEVLVAFPIDRYFSGFGQHEAQFKVFDEVDEDLPEVGFKVEIVGKNAETGEFAFRTTTFSSRVDTKYPGIFDLHMNPLSH